MSDLTQTDEILDWADDGQGLLVEPADLANIIANIDNPIGFMIGSLLGGPNGVPAEDFLTVATSGGMSIGIGGANQRVFAQGRPLDVCPATAFTVPPNSSGQPRVDLIAVQATRVAGSTSVTRNVLASGGVPPFNVVSGTMVAGTVTIPLGATYVAAPACFPSPVGADSAAVVNVTAVSDTDVTVTSSDGSDTRTVLVFVYGNPEGSAGTPTAIFLQQNTAAFQYVTGTPGAGTPLAPSGYESFATVAVSAGATGITAANIDVLFPIIPALNDPLSLHGLYVKDGLSVGDGVHDGPAAFFGIDDLGQVYIAPPVYPGNLSYGGVIFNGAQTIFLLRWDDSGDFWIAGNLNVAGAIAAVGNILTAGQFIGSGAGLTNVPQTALANKNPRLNFGTTPGGYTSGLSATVVLPNDGLAYKVIVKFQLEGTTVSVDIGTPSGGGTSGFAEVHGQGYNSGTVTSTAVCNATGMGQTLSFALTQSGGGTVNAGIWETIAALA
jgi:hypothetical protein